MLASEGSDARPRQVGIDTSLVGSPGLRACLPVGCVDGPAGMVSRPFRRVARTACRFHWR